MGHSLTLDTGRFDINYTAKIRGKNEKDEKWTHIEYNPGEFDPGRPKFKGMDESPKTNDTNYLPPPRI